MKKAFIFPGQGSQSVGMAREFYDSVPEVKALFDKATSVLGYDTAKLCFEGPKEELDRTEKTQPCLLITGMASYTALTLRGVIPDALAGHSLGEYTALAASGAIGFEDALRLTEFRGRTMQDAVPQGKGLMAAVLGLDREKLDAVCLSVKSGYVRAANYNCPGQIVISGEKQAIEEAMELLKSAGAKRAVPLTVSVPSHCALMDGASEKLKDYLTKIHFNTPRIPVVSNADAKFLKNADEIKSALVRQLNGPVLWEDSLRTMRADGITAFVETGPGKVLSGLVKRTIEDATILNAEDLKSLENAVAGLG